MTDNYQRSDDLKIPRKAAGGSWVFPRHWTAPQCAAWVLARGETPSRHEPELLSQIVSGGGFPRVDDVWSRNVEACPALAVVDAGGEWPQFVKDITAKARRYPLSEKQASAVTRFVDESQEEKKRATAGRQTIEGRVLKLKWTDRNSGYGYGASVLKALIQCDGYRLYGTVPSSLAGSIDVGDTLRVDATVEPKELGFGFWSRPRAVALLSGNAKGGE
jgi:hypothetical protein